MQATKQSYEHYGKMRNRSSDETDPSDKHNIWSRDEMSYSRPCNEPHSSDHYMRTGSYFCPIDLE